MTSLLGFSHYNLQAPRALLDTLRHFYVEVVGLREGDRPPFARFGYWLYAGGQPVLHLTESPASERRETAAPVTFDHAAFDAADRAGFERRLARHGIAYQTAHVPLTGQVQLFFRDPAGHGVELNFAADAG